MKNIHALGIITVLSGVFFVFVGELCENAIIAVTGLALICVGYIGVMKE